jgi:L-lactate dehydrogenase complex protein LldG
MVTSREEILNRLRSVQPEVGDFEVTNDYLPVAPGMDRSPQGLLDLFVEVAQNLSCKVYLPANQSQAIQVILELLDDEQRLLSWDFENIPLPGLAEILSEHGIEISSGRDASVKVGLTGADAALAATGSLVLLTGKGKPRLVSLLPPVHIAVITRQQIIPDLESLMTEFREKKPDVFQQNSSIMIISGPSRTADIAMQLILGMHGPRELHIIILT